MQTDVLNLDAYKDPEPTAKTKLKSGAKVTVKKGKKKSEDKSKEKDTSKQSATPKETTKDVKDVKESQDSEDMVKTKKREAKDTILSLIKSEGCTWTDAAAFVADAFQYHERTPYHWLDDVEGLDEEKKPITYRDNVMAAERIRVADAHRALHRAAKGGAVTRDHQVHDKTTTTHFRADGKTPLKKVVREKIETDIGYSPPNGIAAEKLLQRSLLRNNKLDKDAKELEKTPSPLVTMMDEDGNEIPTNVARVEVMLKAEDGQVIEVKKVDRDG